MKVSFFLKTPNAEKSVIFAHFTIAGIRVKYYLKNMAIPVKYWDAKTQKVKGGNTRASMNSLLSDWANKAQNLLYDLQKDKLKTLSKETIKDELDNLFKVAESQDNNKNTYVLDFVQNFITRCYSGVRSNDRTGKPLSIRVGKNHTTTYNHLRDFCIKSKRKNLLFTDIDLNFYNEFMTYLTIDKKMATNSIGKNIQNLKAIINDASDLGIEVNMAYRSKKFKKVSESVENIYLTNEELQYFELLDLSDYSKKATYTLEGTQNTKLLSIGYETLDRVRDLFLIGAHSGMRYSDFVNINTANIDNSLLTFTQQKTQKKLVIPLKDKVLDIIAKYENKAPNAISNQKMNEYLKVIGKMIPALHCKIEFKKTKGGTVESISKCKYELITTHTARRSFATNEYLAGVDFLLIKEITGHSSEKSLINYIKITPKSHAEKLLEIWNNR